MVLDHITVILVEPHHSGNIGSVCRVCKNMGISNVVLVNPQVDYLSDDVFRLGWASGDIIQSMQCVDTLEAAVSGMQVVVGTTMRRRKASFPLFTPKEVVPMLLDVANTHQNVALVFGREANGLLESELNQCNILSTIPTHSMRPAINLAQAVTIYLYEIFQEATKTRTPYNWQLAKKIEVEKMYEQLLIAINTLPFNTRKGSVGFLNLFRRVLNRTPLEDRDVRLFFKLFKLIEFK